MPVVRFSRDRRGYEHTYLVDVTTRGGKSSSRLLYWFRTPPGVKVGREPFDQATRRALESEYPSITFDWPAIVSTSIPPPAIDWRSRRRADRASKAAMRAADVPEEFASKDERESESSTTQDQDEFPVSERLDVADALAEDEPQFLDRENRAAEDAWESVNPPESGNELDLENEPQSGDEHAEQESALESEASDSQIARQGSGAGGDDLPPTADRPPGGANPPNTAEQRHRRRRRRRRGRHRRRPIGLENQLDAGSKPVAAQGERAGSDIGTTAKPDGDGGDDPRGEE